MRQPFDKRQVAGNPVGKSPAMVPPSTKLHKPRRKLTATTNLLAAVPPDWQPSVETQIQANSLK
jgi:hypothetical protein